MGYETDDFKAAVTYPRRKEPIDIEVYLVYDGAGTLIYVGRTNRWGRRRKQHLRNERWWGEVARVEHRYFETYGDAMVAEAILVRDYQPRYNRDGVVK